VTDLAPKPLPEKPPVIVPRDEQIAAVKEAFDTAIGIRANVVGKTKEFAALAQLYDRRIAGLWSALETLRKVEHNG
jgi:hypothetical protein